MRTLDAIIDALLPAWPPLPDESRTAVSAGCARFVRGQLALSPAHIRSGIGLMLGLFYVFAFFHTGMRPLPAVSRQERELAIATFARAGAPFAALERVLRSMTLVAFLEHPDVVAAIGEPASAADDFSTEVNAQ